MILISNDFWDNRKMYSFDPCHVLLAIATNIAVFVLQGHMTKISFFTLAKKMGVSIYTGSAHQHVIGRVNTTKEIM